MAQSVLVQPAVQLRSVTTDNVSFAPSGSTDADSLLVLTPRLDVRTFNPNYRINAAVSADMVTYLGRTGTDRILPRGQAGVSSQLIERFLFLDASVSADRSANNPFGVLEDETTTVFNEGTVYRERFSPYIERELSPRSNFEARADYSWTQSRDGAAQDQDSRYQSHLVRYDLRPQPVGLRLDYSRDTSNISGQSNSRVMFETARAALSYELVPQFRLIVVGGRDHGVYGSNDQSVTLRGGGLRWAPTERTLVDALVERRFFGTGWTASAVHRTPFMILSGSLDRSATTYAEQLATLPAGSDVAQLLDQVLSTRIVNPIERAAAVQQLITQRGLPATLTSAQDIYSAAAQLRQSADLSLALLGVRHTLTLRGYYSRTEDLLGADLPPIVSSNTRQTGATATLTRRLQPDLTANLSLSRSRVVGFGPNTGLKTLNTSLRLGASQLLSQRTSASAAVRYQWVDSTAVGDVSQIAVSFVVLHRF